MNKMRLLFPNMKAFNEFRRALVNEARFASTRNIVTGGSPTARIQQETRALGVPAQLMGDVAQGSSAATTAGRAVMRFLNREPSPAVSRELGPMLLSQNQQQNLARILSSMQARQPRALGPGVATSVGGIATSLPALLAGARRQ